MFNLSRVLLALLKIFSLERETSRMKTKVYDATLLARDAVVHIGLLIFFFVSAFSFAFSALKAAQVVNCQLRFEKKEESQ